MKLTIPISNRCRKYGYIYWTTTHDDVVHKFFNHAKKVEVWFENSYIGEKRIDWKYRRISVGWSRTRAIADNLSEFQLSQRKDGAIRILCK